MLYHDGSDHTATFLTWWARLPNWSRFLDAVTWHRNMLFLCVSQHKCTFLTLPINDVLLYLCSVTCFLVGSTLLRNLQCPRPKVLDKMASWGTTSTCAADGERCRVPFSIVWQAVNRNMCLFSFAIYRANDSNYTLEHVIWNEDVLFQTRRRPHLTCAGNGKHTLYYDNGLF